jgi:hypothetical protein
MTTCEHPDFSVEARVARIVETEDGPVIAFRLELSVRCLHCQQLFAFPGLPGGLTPDCPTVSADCCELRAPLVPFTPFLEFPRPATTPH